MPSELTIGSLGEKEIIRKILRPLFNPNSSPDLAGDDCGVVRIGDDIALCASTDRVPADLISFKLGLIDHYGLGRYLAILNLSDIAAMGATPRGMLLNLALPNDFPLVYFQNLIEGVAQASGRYECPILGGDMSSSSEMSISATVLGIAKYSRLLRRSGAQPGDSVYCSSFLGLTATAFEYFLRAKPAGHSLAPAEEQLLISQFSSPIPRLHLGTLLAAVPGRVTAMDNTDGGAQTLSELAEASGCAFYLDEGALPIHQITKKLSSHLQCNPVELALGPGADFQLLGTIEQPISIELETLGLLRIGAVHEGAGIYLQSPDKRTRPLTIKGWNYFVGAVPTSPDPGKLLS